MAQDDLTRPISAGAAWLRALGVTALIWIVLGLGCFGVLAQYMAGTFRHDLFRGALLLDIGFAAGVVIVVAAIVAWQRSQGEGLRDLGWADRPGGRRW